METKGNVRVRIILGISSVLIILLIITGFCVYFLLDKEVSRYILLGFLVCIIVVGVCISIYVERVRRRSRQRREAGVNGFIEEAYEARNIRPQPSAPPLSERTSWALLPRKWSTGTQLPSYSQ